MDREPPKVGDIVTLPDFPETLQIICIVENNREITMAIAKPITSAPYISIAAPLKSCKHRRKE